MLLSAARGHLPGQLLWTLRLPIVSGSAIHILKEEEHVRVRSFDHSCLEVDIDRLEIASIQQQ
jgi:hypothetical protein